MNLNRSQDDCFTDRCNPTETTELPQQSNDNQLSVQQPASDETLLRNLIRYFQNEEKSDNDDSELSPDPNKFFWNTLSPALESEVFLLKRKPETLDLHQRFSARPSESETQVLDRISVARKEARQVAAYTCITEYLFAEPRIDRHFCYERIFFETSNKHQPKKFIDVGCCVGSDIRKLIYDGFPAHAVTGLDCQPRFFSIGLAMYNQTSETFPVRFVEANLIEPNFAGKYAHLRGQFDYVHSANVIHLFNYEEQMTFLRNLAFLAKPGALLFGRQVGEAEDSPTLSLRIEGKGERFTPNQFRQMWVDATGSQADGWESRLVEYDELRLARDYKKHSLEWMVKAPDRLSTDDQRVMDLKINKLDS